MGLIESGKRNFSLENGDKIIQQGEFNEQEKLTDGKIIYYDKDRNKMIKQGIFKEGELIEGELTIIYHEDGKITVCDKDRNKIYEDIR